MYLQRGHAYIYFSYGNHFMLNVSAEVPGVAGGILIRALEPLEGIAEMERRIANDPDMEIANALEQIGHIARGRLERKFTTTG